MMSGKKEDTLITPIKANLFTALDFGAGLICSSPLSYRHLIDFSTFYVPFDFAQRRYK